MSGRIIPLLLTILFVALPPRAAAQQARPANALGVRIVGAWSPNWDYSVGADLSYQRFFTPRTRLETDLGIRFYDYNAEMKRLYPAMLVATSFQWCWPVGRTAGFYAGPVIQFGRPNYWFGAGVQTGFDWQLESPVQLFVDLRPTWSWWSGFDTSLCVGLRYAFGR